jgi:hypothetical protein
MPISVVCDCGQSYQKPERKIGERFRCHACGRELLIRGSPGAGDVSRSPDTERPRPGRDEPPRERARPAGHVSVGHGYTALWLGAAFLACLAGCSGFAGVMTSMAPPPAAARGGPPPVWVFLIPVAFFGALAALLGWFAFRMTERFEADGEGITWRNRGRVRASFAWRELRYARLEGMSLTLAGPPEAPVLEISTNYQGFDRLLKLLQRSVDWETLVRARPTAETEEPEQPRQQELELPVVRNRRLPFWLAVFGATALAILTVACMRLLLHGPPLPPAQRQALQNDKVGEYAALGMVWVVLPGLVILLMVGACRCWTRFQVDAEGIEFQYFLRKRRYAWDELRSVGVLLVSTTVRQHGATNTSYRHVLQIKTAEDGRLNLGFAEASFYFRDVIVAAADRAGVKLRHE